MCVKEGDSVARKVSVVVIVTVVLTVFFLSEILEDIYVLMRSI